jgi:kanamycin kinase
VSIPAPDLPVPPEVRALVPGARLTPAWRNELGGLTLRVEDPHGGIRYLKHGPRTLETSVESEVARLAWAAPYTPVPRVLAHGGDATREWLLTAALPGESAVAPRWVAEPATAVRAIGRGLRALHDALPVADCPFSWGVPERLANAADRGIRVPDALREPPPVDRLVVCHGDACAPTRSSARTADARVTSTSARWASPTAGPTSRSPR